MTSYVHKVPDTTHPNREQQYSSSLRGWWVKMDLDIYEYI